MRWSSIIFFFLIAFSCKTYCQVNEEKSSQLEQLFLDWNKPNHPGGSIAIAIDGQPVFSKAFGLASLEFLVPNTTETMYNTASVSKQFTAMAIVRLHEQGRLSIDDDIRKYLDYLPDFGHTVTIRHMLHHTSGLRSLHALLSLAGWRSADIRTNADLTRLMKNQRDLNFIPGSERLYCNTGYMFMADIIEKVTDEKYSKWMRSNIFEPLQMNHTYVEDIVNRVVPQNATSYYKNGENFRRSIDFWAYVGSGNMHSTTRNLLSWLRNFHSPQEGWASSFQLLQTLTPFNDGTSNTYAFGVNVVDYMGYKKINHGGSIGGYRSYIASYPDLKLDIAILTNFSTSNPNQLEKRITEILIEAKTNSDENTMPKNIDLNPEELEKWAGQYWNENERATHHIFYKNDSLKIERSQSEKSQSLAPISKNDFLLMNDQGTIISFSKNHKNQNVMTEHRSSGQKIERTYINADELTFFNSEETIGSYYSPEVQTTYRIILKDDELQSYHPRHGYDYLKVLKNDVLIADSVLGLMRFKRNDKGDLTGFFCTNGRVRNMWFDKVE